MLKSCRYMTCGNESILFYETYGKLEQAMCFKKIYRHTKSVDTKILKWTAFNKFDWKQIRIYVFGNGLDVIDLS